MHIRANFKNHHLFATTSPQLPKSEPDNPSPQKHIPSSDNSTSQKKSGLTLSKLWSAVVPLQLGRDVTLPFYNNHSLPPESEMPLHFVSVC